MKKLVLLIVVFVVALGLSSCGSPTGEYTGTSVERYIDNEAGVVCWVYTAPYRGGLDCMPLNETLLGKGGG